MAASSKPFVFSGGNIVGKLRTTEEFVLDAKEVHGDRYDYSKSIYTVAKDKVIITCSVHGDFLQLPHNHIKGHGCVACTGKSRRTTESFMLEAVLVHGEKFDYSLVQYSNCDSDVIIVCPTHGEFKQRPYVHLKGCGCPSCSGKNKKTTDEFISQSKMIHGDRYEYSLVSYMGIKSKVLITCEKHGTFLIKAEGHLNGGGCPKCRGHNKTTEEFIVEAKAIHGDKSVYTGATDKLNIFCKIHGEFKQSPTDHLLGKGCAKCAGKNKTTDGFISEAKTIHGNLYDYRHVTYLSQVEKVSIVCSVHGEFKQEPRSHLAGAGCPKCAKTGFDPAKPSVFYIYAFEEYAGFGITGDFKSRNTQHQLNFKKKSIDATLVATYNMSGESALDLERHIKQTLPIVNACIDGFKTEAVHIDNIHLLLTTVKENLK